MATIAPIAISEHSHDVGPKLFVSALGKNRFRVEMDAVTFMKLHPRSGEVLEASKFFTDADADGEAVTVHGPFHQKRCDRYNGWEMIFRFTVTRHAG